MENPIMKIDWSALTNQKQTLLAVISDLENSGNIVKASELTSILHLIDGIQDYAVAELDVPEEKVFELVWTEQQVEKLGDEVENKLSSMFRKMAMDDPHNFNDICEFIENDIQEMTNPKDWNDSDFTIGYRRWIEAQAINQP